MAALPPLSLAFDDDDGNSTPRAASPSVSGALSPAPSPSAVDAAIQRMLETQPDVDSSEWDSHQREVLDRQRLEQVESLFTTGDTLVIVDFPSNPLRRNCAGSRWRSVRFRIDSHRLLATGSSVFAKLLSEPKQARTRRRLSLDLGDLSATYVLDLTPSEEGDDVASQLALLSLPESVRDWWMSHERLEVSRFLVCGHDDHCPHHLDVPLRCERLPATDTPLDEKAAAAPLPRLRNAHQNSYPPPDETLDLDDVAPSPARIIDDYCPVRHRANIIRLVLSLMGHDLVLNSAPRVYTLVGIAKILDCRDVIKDAVFTWLIAQPNTTLLDCHPEVALHIAWTLEIPDVTRAVFRLLVAERTIEVVGGDDHPEGVSHSLTCSNSTRTTLFGRRREALPDEPRNTIEHATQRNAERARRAAHDMRLGRHGCEEAEIALDSWLAVPEWQEFKRVGEWLGATLYHEDEHESEQDQHEELIYHGEVQGGDNIDAIRARFLKRTRRLFGSLTWQIRDAVARTVINAVTNTDTTGVASSDGESADNLIDVNDDTDERDTWWRPCDSDRRCFVRRRDFRPTRSVHASLNVTQRLLTPAFWRVLQCGLAGIGHDTHKKPFILAVAVNDFNSCASLYKSLHADVAWPEGGWMARLSRRNAKPALTPGGASQHLQGLGNNGRLHFDLDRFVIQLRDAVVRLRGAWEHTPQALEAGGGMSLSRRYLALGLTGAEFGYLPLWAGGLDDGTGAVFQDLADEEGASGAGAGLPGVVPDAIMGPIGPGPNYNTGYTVASSSSSLTTDTIEGRTDRGAAPSSMLDPEDQEIGDDCARSRRSDSVFHHVALPPAVAGATPGLASGRSSRSSSDADTVTLVGTGVGDPSTAGAAAASRSYTAPLSPAPLRGPGGGPLASVSTASSSWVVPASGGDGSSADAPSVRTLEGEEGDGIAEVVMTAPAGVANNEDVAMEDVGGGRDNDEQDFTIDDEDSDVNDDNDDNEFNDEDYEDDASDQAWSLVGE